MTSSSATLRVRPPLDRPDTPLSAPSWWDDPPHNEAADHAVSRIQAMPLTEDEGLRRRLTLGDVWLPWQDKVTRHIYGRLDADGKRIIRTVYIEMPKKSGKSHWCAGAMDYELLYGLPGGQLYSAAADLGQAMVVWRIAKKMVELVPQLREIIHITDYPGEHSLRYNRKKSLYSPLTRKAASKHGLSPSVVCIDELHAQEDRDFVSTLEGSMGARSEPLWLAVTNSGHNRTSLCYEKRADVMRVNAGEAEDPSLLGVVYGAEEGADHWSEETWKRANPGIGTTVGVDWVAQKAEEARRLPTKLNAFLRWQLGIWTQQVTRWIGPEAWDRCAAEFTEDDLLGMPAIGGFDLGLVDDLSAWVVLFGSGRDTPLRVRCAAWCPQAKLDDEDNPNRHLYRAWAREGYLTVVPGAVIDTTVIEERIAADCERYRIGEVAMDLYLALDLASRLEKRGIKPAGIGQGYKSMSGPCLELERRVLSDPPLLEHDGNPLLAWTIGNVQLRHKANSENEVTPDKEQRHQKIDPVVAMLMALSRVMLHEDHGPKGPPRISVLEW